MKWCCCLSVKPEESKPADQQTRERSADPKPADQDTREGSTDPKPADQYTKKGSTDQYTRREQLKIIYNKHFRSADLYRTVRILVVGRSGCGKTTLIRLIVGKEGPCHLGDQAVAGDQDIRKEWRCLQDEGLPELVIHDSNGMDVRGEENLQTVKQFIEERQKRNEESERINLIWYVFSASDNRFADDCNLMGIVADSAIPVLLIMTYNDIPELVEQHVTDDNVNRLLKDIRNERKRDKIKAQMVRIGNKVKLNKNTNEITGLQDKQGLKEISKKSMKLLDGKLKYTLKRFHSGKITKST